MSAAIFLMSLLGCGEGEAPCRQIRTLEARYETEAACTAATEAVLLLNTDADYPIIVAQCHRAGSVPRVMSTDV